MPPAVPDANPEVSIIAPAHNEAENIAPLIDELDEIIHQLDESCEIIIVDDASTDETHAELARASEHRPHLRIITLPQRPDRRPYGQTAALHSAIRAARGDVIAMLDADLQNDPADIPTLLQVMRATGADLVQGDRSHARCDNFIKRASSVVGRITRRLILADTVRDTGCSMRLITRELALQLPLEFRGMHRFIPITAKQLGATVVEHPVNHRPRRAGQTKYGIWNRALPGLIDCFVVRWMRNRRANRLHTD